MESVFFELHDESCKKGFIQTIREILPEDKILFSSQLNQSFCSIKNKKNWSWDLNLGDPPKGVSIVSLHNREQKNLKQILEKLSFYKKFHLKLAIEIFNLQELKEAYNWQKEDPKNRSFLPRSPEGRWKWFRNAFGSSMLLHFIKEQENSFPDQPFFTEAIYFLKKKKALGAVLGDPVDFSATPSEQGLFFYKKRNIPVLPVLLKEEEMTKENLKIFSELGFVFFAITSPLKEQSFLAADICDKTSQEFKTANTLIFHNKKWWTFNTDWKGLQKVKKYSANDTVVWGGGGTRPILKKLLPLAFFYSARTGNPLNFHKQSFKKSSPKTLVWAVGRKRMQQGALWPPKHWKPAQVIDINYTEDSPGREYALKTGAKYQDGMSFFKKQAEQQRETFSYLEKDIFSKSFYN